MNLIFQLVVGCVVIAGGILMYLGNNPAVGRWLPHCVFHDLTGLFCPGCGNTRALRALLHGDLFLSLRYNLLLIPAFAIIAMLWWRPALALKPSVAWTIAVVVTAFVVLRNIPVMPFLLLAPP